MKLGKWVLFALGMPPRSIGSAIKNTKIFKHVYRWFEEAPEDSWDIWHKGNI